MSMERVRVSRNVLMSTPASMGRMRISKNVLVWVAMLVRRPASRH